MARELASGFESSILDVRMTIQQALQVAIGHHQAGRFAEAETIYSQIVAQQPGFADAHHLLGALKISTGDFQKAVEHIRRAIGINPADAGYFSNLGLALANLGWLDESARSLKRAIELKPDFAEAFVNLSETFRQLKRYDEAITAARQAIALHPNSPQPYNNLGNTLREQGDLPGAIDAYRHATRVDPVQAESWFNLGVVLVLDKQYAEAAEVFATITRLRPGWAEAFGYLGGCLRRLDRIDEAVAAFQHAVKIKPELADAWNDLGTSLKDRGEIGEGLNAYRKAVEIDPSQPSFLSNLIYTMHFDPASDSAAIAAAHANWNRTHGSASVSRIATHANGRSPERRLRIGYVSSHFYNQAEACFVLPLLESHDPEQVKVYCYSSVRNPDAFTERHRKAAHLWRDVNDLTNDRLAQAIRDDQIDVLIDLTMHMGNNRMPVFVRKPAPIQLSWLAYPGTSGVDAIDGWLSDPQLSPMDDADEKAIRLPNCWCCYDPLVEENDFPMSNPPASLNGRTTFGSLNNPGKINTGVIQLWAGAMRMVVKSRIVILSHSRKQQEQIVAQFESQQIGADRIAFVGPTDRATYLRRFNEIDIMLDPQPYNGITTTCDALWMGVPVITLVGKMPQSRAGWTVLHNSGLGKFVADSADQFAKIAREWSDVDKLATLRASLRQRLVHSPLMDANRFARDVETIYRRLWIRWCSK